EKGVKHKESNAQGSPSERIGEFSKFYDLMVTGLRNRYHFETSEEVENSLEDILDISVTPIIAVPDKDSKFSSGSDTFKVVFAYNGSIPATRAMQNFARMEFPKKIDATIFVSKDDLEEAETLYQNAHEYLESHGVSNIHKFVTDEDKIAIFNSNFLEDFDIIILGAHSKIGIFDFLVGSLTKHLINENKTMLFISP
ncbi:hypothetical protein ACFLSQ_11445, partial [Bacteroidota bacterium]